MNFDGNTARILSCICFSKIVTLFFFFTEQLCFFFTHMNNVLCFVSLNPSTNVYDLQ